MKKKLICFAMAMMLILSSSVTALASSSNAYHDTSLLDPTSNLQLESVQMQLELAELAKQQALDKMAELQKLQEEQMQVSEFLNTARQCWSEAESTGEATEMPADMAEYMDSNGLSYDTTGDDLLMTAEEWDVAIASLEARLEKLSTESQQQTVYLDTFMGQYNSYLQGANTQLSNANQRLTELARGQSMYGTSEAGLAVTGLVLGLVLGCALTLTVQKVRRKKDAV